MIKFSVTLIGVAIIVTALLSACTPKPEPKTVDFYLTHKAERMKVFDECRNNPGKLKGEPDCINAAEAVLKAQATDPVAPVRF